MRNLREHPVTKAEMYDFLNRTLAKWLFGNPAPGDLDGAIIYALTILVEKYGPDAVEKHDA